MNEKRHLFPQYKIECWKDKDFFSLVWPQMKGEKIEREYRTKTQKRENYELEKKKKNKL